MLLLCCGPWTQLSKWYQVLKWKDNLSALARGRRGGDRQGLASVIHYSEPIFSPLANFPGPVYSGGTGRRLLPNVLFILWRKKRSLLSGSLGGLLVLADGSNGNRYSFFQVSDVSWCSGAV